MPNIYWRDVPRNAKLEVHGSSYYYKGKMLYWTGQEAAEAQTWANNHIGTANGKAVRRVGGEYKLVNKVEW